MVHGSVAQSELSKSANDETAIRSVMASYNDALNSGSTGAAMGLYAEDGVFIRPTANPRSARKRSARPMTPSSRN